MRIFKTLIIAAFAFATAAGTLLAADDPLEIHGGGRVGFVVNGKLGSETGSYANNALGTMPNYGESSYFGFSFSKKFTSEGGAWAKVNYSFDNSSLADLDQDCQPFTPRTRATNVEFGGLDFLPAGTVLWGGLKGYGSGWNGMQDHSFINFSGVGIGLQNIGGVFSLAYMSYDQDDAQNLKLGERVTHNIVANISVPVVEVWGAFGFSKKSDAKRADGKSEENMTEFYVGGIYHAPVYGINVGLSFQTNAYAAETYGNSYDTILKDHAWTTNSSAGYSKKENACQGVRALVWTVTDLAPGFYVAPSFRYDMLMVGKDALAYGGKSIGKKNTWNRIDIAMKVSKALTKNIAFCPNFGFEREWDKEKAVNAKPHQLIQITPAFEMGLDTGFWAGQKLQLYGTFTKTDSDHKFAGGAYDGKTSGMTFGMLVTFGF